jgi:putative ABC transport system substrate-binding protein
MDLSQGDPEGQARLRALMDELPPAASVEVRWAGGDPVQTKALAAELVALSPDVILASGGPVADALTLLTRSIPIVFVQIVDPVNRGLVSNMARPGGNVTGFINFETSMGGKWVELLRALAPHAR